WPRHQVPPVSLGVGRWYEDAGPAGHSARSQRSMSNSFRYCWPGGYETPGTEWPHDTDSVVCPCEPSCGVQSTTMVLAHARARQHTYIVEPGENSRPCWTTVSNAHRRAQDGVLRRATQRTAILEPCGTMQT